MALTIFSYTNGMKKIYRTDLDYTFLRSDLFVSDYTKNIWNSYKDEAILTVATRDAKIIDTKFVTKEVADEVQYILAPEAYMGCYYTNDEDGVACYLEGIKNAKEIE